ncbi:unnamed protein product [Trichobilharzia szidati]|nr:unnamed protein product [Trichobilharzia szidati]
MTSNHETSGDHYVDSICIGVSKILDSNNSDEDVSTEPTPYPSVSNDIDSDAYYPIEEPSHGKRVLEINPKSVVKDSKHGTRLGNWRRGSDFSKKAVFVQPHDGKLFKVVSKHNMKKTKPPDISKEVAQCRESHSDYLDFSNMNLQQIPNGIFKDLSFIKDLFLYGNKLTALPSSISHLTNLRRLLLQQNWLTAAGIPNEITKLTNLEQLDLRYNRLDGPLPTCICGLCNLEHLLLTYNKLTHIVDEIKYLKHLSVLVVSRNLIRQDLPSSIGELTKLVKLDLSFNHITFLPDSIGQCTSLRDLNLQHNQLTKLPDSIGNLVNLCRLSIKYNQLVEIPASLANCVKLDEFNVENNQLSSLPHNLLSYLPNLLNITLSRNYFTNFPSGDPQQFQKCYTINMDHNQITNIPKSMFSLATNLTKLNLRDNTLASLIGPDLHELKTLVELDLGSNHLTELPIEINTLIALEVLRLNYNQLTCLPDEITQLSKLRILDLESNLLESLPDDLSGLTSLQELNVLCNRLKTFPASIGRLTKLKVIMAGENDISEIPVEIGNITALHDLHLNNNPNLNSLPAELSLCSKLIILNLESCPLRALPEPIVQGGSAMIIYFLQQVLQLRRQQNML